MKHRFYGVFMSIHLCFGISYTAISQGSARYQDCSTAFPVCELKTYYFDDMTGVGDELEAKVQPNCFQGQFFETNSKWLKWKVKESGIITFVINPFKENDDFDFVLFRRTYDRCSNLEEVRCMATGRNLESSDAGRCLGKTGLSVSSLDDFESTGCKFSSDNFLKMLKAEEGEEFLLLINNFESSMGFSISMEGDAILYPYDKECLDIAQPLYITGIFPNPAFNTINIEFRSNSQDNVVFEILDITGKKYFILDVKPNLGVNLQTLNISNLPEASYLVKVRQGGFITTKQFQKIN